MVKWFPWKWLVRRTVRSHGLIDPFTLLARLRKFAEPSEVDVPLELIRAWTVFQARGIVNTRAIQHNLDWVWPYWVERQFNPRDPAFVPRSFSLAHINLTHRNWTAVCVPDAERYAIVDPRGLVTPLHDGWSIDAWLVRGDAALAPSRCRNAEQTMRHDGVLAVETRVAEDGMHLISRAEMHHAAEGGLRLEIAYRAQSDPPAALCIALRPYNPEGVQFIDTVKPVRAGAGWLVNRKTRVLLDRAPARYAASAYKRGDVFNQLDSAGAGRAIECPVGMATAVAVFPAHAGATNRVTVSVPIEDRANVLAAPQARRPRTSWTALDELTPVLDVPDPHMTYLFRTSARTLLSLSAADVYPGSYTYRRFWFRDACLMLHALLTLNHHECCRRAFETSFPHRQTVAGFFQSQQGEWDSNGQVLWLAGRYRELTGEPLPPRALKSLRKGAEWLCRKRLSRRGPHPGLLPPGFSAEHLGPNNHYYWDNFWGLAGLRAAAGMFRETGDTATAAELEAVANEYERDILTSVDAASRERGKGGVPAAPSRRMDAGAIGSVAADYPLQLFAAGDPRIMHTVEFLLDNCMIDNGFFHDMTHSGINPYLTLHLAQVLLRAGDARYAPLVRRVAALASATGQWPEAVHPRTGGGCMGDGQHGWAAAEWVLMMRALFVREESDRLVVGAGLLPEWLASGRPLRFGPTPTRFGAVTVHVDTAAAKPRIDVDARWHAAPPSIVYPTITKDQGPRTNDQ